MRSVSTDRESCCCCCVVRLLSFAGLTAGDWDGRVGFVEDSVDVSVSFVFRWMGRVNVSGS